MTERKSYHRSSGRNLPWDMSGETVDYDAGPINQNLEEDMSSGINCPERKLEKENCKFTGQL